MNEEEKEAVEDIKRELCDEDRKEYMSSWFAKDLDIAVNLIDKLQKENEELHKEIDRMKSLDIYELVEDWETGQLIPIQKIKDKIEELKKEGDYRTVDNPCGRIHFMPELCDYKIQVLKELLEESEEN